MSFLEKLKVNKLANNNIIKNELKLYDLNKNVFPYSCLVADDVVLTKNGEVLQIIEILLDDFKLNQEGGLREAVRKSISENISDFKTAFWIQTVKRKKKRAKREKTDLKHEFLKRVYDISKQYEENLNNYTTTVYITVIRQGRNFKLKHIKDYISTAFLNHMHDKYIDDSIVELKMITNSLVEALNIYSPKILSIRTDSDGNEFSELLETLYFLINFKDKEILIQPVDATNLLNDSSYIFKNGIMALQNKISNDLTVAMSFSLKEVPRINMSNVSDIINNTRAELIITEYVSYIDRNTAISHFKKQKSFLDNRYDKSFQDKVGLGFLIGNNNTKYCQSSISLMILADDTSKLKTLVSDVIDMFSKHGIVMAREDISLERNYYAIMPANFSFTHRLTVHDAAEVACFCYSHVPQEYDVSKLLKRTVLFNIGTLKSNIVQIGLDREKPNVMICGNKNSGKSVMSNFLASSVINEFNADVCIIEFNCKSRVFIDAIGGKWYSISTERQNHTALFNNMNINIFEDEKSIDNYLIEVISMLLNANNVIITPEIALEIRKICDYIKNYAKNNKNFALHDIRHFFEQTSICQDLQCWHSIGKYYHLFDNRSDVFDTDRFLAFYIDNTITDNSSILALIINHIFTNIIQRAKKSSRPMFVILDEPFLAFGNSFFKSKINSILETMTRYNVYCIFKISNIAAESSTIVDFSQIINSCGLQMHFANKLADSNYGRVFKLTNLEYMAIQALSGYNGKNLIVKQRDQLYSCSFDLSKYPKLLGILSDTGDTQAQIFKIKEILQTDSFERWIPAYFNEFIDNKNAEEKRKLQKEIKAIQDIKRLMES